MSLRAAETIVPIITTAAARGLNDCLYSFLVVPYFNYGIIGPKALLSLFLPPY